MDKMTTYFDNMRDETKQRQHAKPAWAKRIAVCCPTPEPPPVIKHVRPSMDTGEASPLRNIFHVAYPAASAIAAFAIRI
jgi:hypothetical protein